MFIVVDGKLINYKDICYAKNCDDYSQIFFKCGGSCTSSFTVEQLYNAILLEESIDGWEPEEDEDEVDNAG